MWYGEFVVKNAMEQTCEIEINLSHCNKFYARCWL